MGRNHRKEDFSIIQGRDFYPLGLPDIEVFGLRRSEPLIPGVCVEVPFCSSPCTETHERQRETGLHLPTPRSGSP